MKNRIHLYIVTSINATSTQKALLNLVWPILMLGMSFTPLMAQNVGINFNGAAPNASAALDINVSALFPTKKGLLIPVVTSDQRLAMNPLPEVAEGLLVYQTKTGNAKPGFYYNNSTTLVPDWKLIANEQALPWNSLENPNGATVVNHGQHSTIFSFDGAIENIPFQIRSNSLTKGALLRLNISSNTGESAFTSTVLQIERGGANVNSNHSTRGISSTVTNTGTSSTNIAGRFSSSGGTNNIAILVPPNGGKVILGSESSAANAILSINNGHFQAQQTTRPTITTTANAGILSAGTVEQFSSDVAGTFNINTTVNTGLGEQATITFNENYSRPPIVIVTAANASGASRLFWVDSSNSSFKIFFTSPPAQSTTYTYNYMVIAN